MSPQPSPSNNRGSNSANRPAPAGANRSAAPAGNRSAATPPGTAPAGNRSAAPGGNRGAGPGGNRGGGPGRKSGGKKGRRGFLGNRNAKKNTAEASAEDQIELEGVVSAVLAGTMFKVKLPNGHELLAHISGKMRKRFIRLVVGDKVKLEMSPYDTTKARITFRIG